MPPRRTVPPLSPEHEALGNAVRALRVRLELTQEEVADRAETDPKQVGCIERGTRNASYATLVRLAAALETRVGAVTGLADRLLDRG